MIRISKPLVLVLTTLAAAAPAAAQEIENELVLVTPVAKTLTDPALAEFAKYAKERWNVTVRTSALAAGTPVAYGRIVEWKGRPEADIFWGGESALYDKLAEQKLLAKLDLPKSVRGVIVTKVNDDDSELRTGDVITELDRKPVKNAQDAVADTENPAGKQTLVKVWTKSGSHYLTVDESHES